MKYTVLRVDDSRQWLTNQLYRKVPRDWEYARQRPVDGRKPGVLKAAAKRHPYEIIPNETMGWPRAGHLGVWYANLNALRKAPIVIFEDDAILSDNFAKQWEVYSRALPEDADFFCMYTPQDHAYDLYRTSRHYKGPVTKLWQPNGNVGTYWTKAGAEKFVELVKRDGMKAQIDNAMADYSWRGEMNGYGLSPYLRPMVTVDAAVPSIAQESAYAGFN
jgi:hypothetical protein